MELGDPDTGERGERSPLDVVLDKLNAVFAELLDTVDSGGLDRLSAAEKVVWWQRFETFRNRLPLIEHGLIADAEATDLAGGYSFSDLARFLVRMFQLSPGGAAAPGCGRRPRSARAPRCWGNGWNRCCRGWPRCNATVPSPSRRCRLWNGPCTKRHVPGCPPDN